MADPALILVKHEKKIYEFFEKYGAPEFLPEVLNHTTADEFLPDIVLKKAYYEEVYRDGLSVLAHKYTEIPLTKTELMVLNIGEKLTGKYQMKENYKFNETAFKNWAARKVWTDYATDEILDVYDEDKPVDFTGYDYIYLLNGDEMRFLPCRIEWIKDQAYNAKVARALNDDLNFGKLFDFKMLWDIGVPIPDGEIKDDRPFEELVQNNLREKYPQVWNLNYYTLKRYKREKKKTTHLH